MEWSAVSCGPTLDESAIWNKTIQIIQLHKCLKKICQVSTNQYKSASSSSIHVHSSHEPDEEFFATAYMLPEAPKTHLPGNKVQFVKTFFTPEFPKNLKCTGKVVHHCCILNVRDIPLLHKYKSGQSTIFFYNKYFMEYDHVVMDCMEQRIVEQNKLEYKRDCLI